MKDRNKHRTQQFKQLGLTVAYYRRIKGLTQQELAEKIGVSRTHISNLEAPNMPVSLSLDKLMDISDVLDVPVKKLLDFRE